VVHIRSSAEEVKSLINSGESIGVIKEILNHIFGLEVVGFDKFGKSGVEGLHEFVNGGGDVKGVD
jgi:hypothetical protein